MTLFCLWRRHCPPTMSGGFFIGSAVPEEFRKRGDTVGEPPRGVNCALYAASLNSEKRGESIAFSSSGRAAFAPLSSSAKIYSQPAADRKGMSALSIMTPYFQTQSHSRHAKRCWLNAYGGRWQSMGGLRMPIR